jgi:hypothetical protein
MRTNKERLSILIIPLIIAILITWITVETVSSLPAEATAACNKIKNPKCQYKKETKDIFEDESSGVEQKLSFQIGKCTFYVNSCNIGFSGYNPTLNCNISMTCKPPDPPPQKLPLPPRSLDPLDITRPAPEGAPTISSAAASAAANPDTDTSDGASIADTGTTTSSDGTFSIPGILNVGEGRILCFKAPCPGTGSTGTTTLPPPDDATTTPPPLEDTSQPIAEEPVFQAQVCPPVCGGDGTTTPPPASSSSPPPADDTTTTPPPADDTTTTPPPADDSPPEPEESEEEGLPLNHQESVSDDELGEEEETEEIEEIDDTEPEVEEDDDGGEDGGDEGDGGEDGGDDTRSDSEE